MAQLRAFPPLVTSWEIEHLRRLLAEAELGRRFVLQGGDCAETLEDCTSGSITNRLKILLQMSLVLVHGSMLPVVRVGRIAGQYAKPRSSPTERRDGVEFPSYLGDLMNRPAFTAEARRIDPGWMLEGYKHAALTLNFVRSLSSGGFADLHHPEYWDLTFASRTELPQTLREEYERTSRQLAAALRFMEALGETSIADLTRVDLFTSHEGLNLHYESAQTRTVPRRAGYYDLTTHLPWIGERTRQLDGAHVELFRGVRNPIGVKLGPSTSPEELVELTRVLNPENEGGKLVLITRMGAASVRDKLPPLLEAIQSTSRRALWMCDPMHGNTRIASGGIKTRVFDEILDELSGAFEAHERVGTLLGGVHFELTGDAVTECVGRGVSEADLSLNYSTACDPRLNYAQALEMSFLLARRLGVHRR